ncbi:MAG: acyl-[acyl-carrier-protein]-phospholipid O-acyltransferase [Verrucomicrobiales bacterium]|jgi:acyl-[acyl-carrier-protein]-phospholipid O-acyltransferase/long-chain-fatty-acid--[acyl-carrier-protein] ligase
MKSSLTANEHPISTSGALLVPAKMNAASFAAIRADVGERKLHFLHESDATLDSGVEAALQEMRATRQTITVEKPKQGEIKAIKNMIAKGELVLFMPSVAEGWPAWTCQSPSETLKALLQCEVPIQPVGVSVLPPPGSNCPDTAVRYGELVEPGADALPHFWERLFAANEAALSSRPFLTGSLGYAIIRSLKRYGSISKVIDGLDSSELGYDKVLAVACALSRLIKKETQAERVGIILPPGKGGLIANLAVVLAGKKPVNLNFTAGKGAVESAMKQAGLDRYITADPFVRKLQTFPWPPNRNLIFLERIIPTLKPKIAFWLVLSKILPAGALAALLGIRDKGDREEAGLLFTSGSSGDPKGVILSHRNLLSNVQQFGARLDLNPDEDKVLGCLPLFHSFGFTVTIWYPILNGIDLVTYPSPIDAPKLAGLIEKYGITVMLATPTFLRGYLRKVNREQLATLKLIATGAEKLPLKLAQTFSEKFGKEVMEGYGLTETSPVSNINLPERSSTSQRTLPSCKSGSVGHLVPGLALRITDSSTGERLPIDRQGLIWFKGANVFDGYHNRPEITRKVIDDAGWFCTGDLGRVDEDGFLFIEGRLSRFSKIGGEMVPHETLEALINQALGLDDETERKIAIVGVPDEAKGEALVLLSAISTETDAPKTLSDLRSKLLEEGVAALWIPKQIRAVDAIPILASGKLDIKGCENLSRK